MIEVDVIKWLAVAMSDLDSLSEFSLEYGAALLMNLSLRNSGKLKCFSQQFDILQVLNDLLEHENPRVRTYVNGTLYSVLSLKEMKERAKEMGMEDIFR